MRKRILLIVLTICSCVGCDQVTKSFAKSFLPKHEIISFARDTFRLDYAENKGAVLSFEESLPEKWQGDMFSIAVTAFMILLSLYLFLSRSLSLPSVLGLSLLCGGTLSNMLDRVVLGGNVVDFLNFGWGCFRSSIFNVADVAIVMGSVLFLLNLAWRFGAAISGKLLHPMR